MKRIYISLILGTACLTSFAQHELADTLSMRNNQPTTPELQQTDTNASENKTLYQYGEKFEEYRDSIGLNHHADTDYTFTPGQATVLRWYNGALIATGGSQSMPGLMGLEQGMINLNQQFGKFSISAYGSATKIGYFRGLSTQWGYGGSLTYQLNDNLSFTAFGSYSTRAKIGQPAIMGYADYPAFGGYANYLFGDSHWGVKVGAQSYHSLSSGHWEAQPIVMPYYRLNNGAELGIDVGGILYNLIRGNTGSNFGNPTIAPPKANIPPVR